MCKCIKDSLTNLKNNDIGRAKFSLLSREYEYAEMDIEKANHKLDDVHNVNMYRGLAVEEYKLKKDEKGKALKEVKTTVQKVLGYQDPFSGVV